jgi:hypothetical protein
MFLKKKISLRFILDKIIGLNSTEYSDDALALRIAIHSIIINSQYKYVCYTLSGYIRDNCIYLQVNTSIDASILHYIKNDISEKIGCFRKNIKVKDFKVYCNQDQVL